MVLKQARFQAGQFTSMDRSDTAQDKADFANRFVRFVESDFKRTLFTIGFYDRLMMSFGHIAHYNREGFYGLFFSSLGSKIAFLRQTVEWDCGGDPRHTYCDVEKALREWVLREGLVEKYRALRDAEVESAERALLKQLKAKYPEG